MLSPGSRGKGGRRAPGRDGGRRKQKGVAWRKQAMHAVDDATQLGELVELSFMCPFGQSAAESIYLFDQEMARAGIRYCPELRGSLRFPRFSLLVPADCADAVRAIITQIQK